MQGRPEQNALRTRIYIDGYNFYYGCLRGTPYKWLDLLPLFETQILPSALIRDDNGHIQQSVLLRSHTNVLIGVVVPTTDRTRSPNTDLVKFAHWKREHVTASELAACQLPRVIQGRKPTTKPESWYGQPALLGEILELAIPVRGSRAAAFKWMEQPNEHLGGERTIELAETVAGANRVLAYIREWISQQALLVDPAEQGGSGV